MTLLSFVMGCIYVERTVSWEESGDSGLSTPPLGEGEPCTSDAQCPGENACRGSVSTFTDGNGCVERCEGDQDCKAGSLCLDDGACG